MLLLTLEKISRQSIFCRNGVLTHLQKVLESSMDVTIHLF